MIVWAIEDDGYLVGHMPGRGVAACWIGSDDDRHGDSLERARMAIVMRLAMLPEARW